ncbi:MAG: hypothetical protein ACAI38_18030 [Myxococcota bacterium]|nr:hypothetical protein [Myxococcota bacterium]
MLIEQQLSYAHVGVGVVDEYAATTLAAAAQSSRLVAGRSNTAAQITNRAGKILHFGNYVTRLTVPVSRLLRRFSAWDHLRLGVTGGSYGNMLFETKCALGSTSELTEDPEKRAPTDLPSMAASGAFWLEDDGREPEMSLPRAELLATLPQLDAAPQSIQRFRDVRGIGTLDEGFVGNVTRGARLSYQISAGRDCAPGHPVTCSQFVRVLDFAQRQVLTRMVQTPFPTAIVDMLSVVDSETMLFDRCRGEDVLRIDLRVSISNDLEALGTPAQDFTVVGVVDTVSEIHLERTNALVVASRTRKVIALPPVAQTLVKDAERMLRFYASHPR